MTGQEYWKRFQTGGVKLGVGVGVGGWADVVGLDLALQVLWCKIN